MPMKSIKDLILLLKQIDHKGYPAYKSLKGAYKSKDFLLSIDHVQSDPFAAPSDVSISVLNTFPEKYFDTEYKKTALEDFVLQEFSSALNKIHLKNMGSGKSGRLSVSSLSQQVLKKSACEINKEQVIVHFHIGFPALGRRIDVKGLEEFLNKYLEKLVWHALNYQGYTSGQKEELAASIELAEDQHRIRQYLNEHQLAAFVGNGSILPRAAGNSQKPMENAVAFESPKNLEIIIPLSNHKEIKGMAIPKGITLIVGGGYHGKSTLLQALQLGIYNHRLGDGREYVICDESAYKSRAEDGRSIASTNISAFIQNLPNQADTADFSTLNASGSTSQAAGIAEAISSGAKVLLMDEDTSATNFMIRDALMQSVIHPNQEPIIPFIERIKDLYEKNGVSTILVAGSSGSFFDKANLILQMDSYKPYDITRTAKAKAADYENKYPALKISHAAYDPNSLYTQKQMLPSPAFFKEKTKIKSQGLDSVSINREEIDLRLAEQLVHPEQLKTIGAVLLEMAKENEKEAGTIQELASRVYKKLDKEGFKILKGKDLSYVRKQDVLAALERMPSQKFKQV